MAGLIGTLEYLRTRFQPPFSDRKTDFLTPAGNIRIVIQSSRKKSFGRFSMFICERGEPDDLGGIYTLVMPIGNDNPNKSSFFGENRKQTFGNIFKVIACSRCIGRGHAG